MQLTYIRPSKQRKYQKGFIQVHKQDIRMLGHTEALILSEIESWCKYNATEGKTETHYRDKKWWMYMKAEDWADELTISKKTFRRAIKKLRDLHVIHVEKFSAKNGNQVYWYALNETGLDVITANWFAYGHPASNSNGLYSDFIGEHKKLADKIDKGFTKAQDELKRLERIITEGQEVSTKNDAPSGQNVHMSDNAVSEGACGQNVHLHVDKMSTSYTNTTSDTNLKDSGEKISEKSEGKIDPYLQDDLIPETQSDSPGFWDYKLPHWVKGKNGCGKTKVNGHRSQLEAELNYDGSMISALRLYEEDKIYRDWCELQYTERHGKFKKKHIPLGVEETVKLITENVAFHTYRAKGHAKYDLEDEMPEEYAVESDLWEEV